MFLPFYLEKEIREKISDVFSDAGIDDYRDDMFSDEILEIIEKHLGSLQEKVNIK